MKKVLLLFVFYVYIIFINHKSLAQNTLFLSRLEVQTNQGMLFPDYFKNTQLGDSIRNEVHRLWKKVLNVDEVASRKSPAIDYTPVVSREKPVMRSISQTNFTYIAWVIGELKAENEKKGLLILESEVFDKQDRKVWKNRVKIPIEFQGKAFEKNDIIINKDDFKKILLYGLQKLFKQNINTQKFVCIPPIDTQSNIFLENAQKSQLIFRDRGVIDWINNIGTQTMALKLNAPFIKDNMFVRTATFENIFNQKKYQLQAHKEPKRQFEKQIDFYEQNVAVGSFVLLKTNHNESWVGKANQSQMMLDMDKKTQKIQFLINKTNLLAVLLPAEKATEERNNNGFLYDLYLSKNILEEEKSWLFNLLLSNALSESVEIFYKTETEGYKEKK